MILVKSLYLRYIREYYALSDINLEIKKGEKLCLVGEDGSGKTSLIRVLAKLEKPTSGEVYLKNVPLEKVNFKTDISVGYIPALPIYLKNKTVYQNFAYILKQYKTPKLEIEEKINQVLKNFNIQNFKNEKFNKLSLYEKYVVSFARLALRKIELLLVDDIFEKLESQQQTEIVKLIKTNFLNQENLTSVFATSSEQIANQVCKNKVFFKYGSLVDQQGKII